MTSSQCISVLSPALSQVTHFLFCNRDECIFKHYQDCPEAASEVIT